MVLFDAVAAPITFKESFVSEYADTACYTFDAGAIDGFIDRRVATLTAWLDDVDHAPIGIRTASPAWHSTLRAFVHEFNRTWARGRPIAPPHQSL